MYSDTVIRQCKKDDNFMDISKLYLKTWQTAYKNILPKSLLDKMNLETWKPKKRWKDTIIATKDNKIVGVCSFGKIRHSNDCKFGEIYPLYIDPEQQKLGIGKRIINKAIKDLIKSNYEKILLWVIYNNYSAINFYKKMGLSQIEK
ncbi:GNAT family N-acetyltransferase [Apilactobacillus timberlakei]|uniref:GNAT family N-acetyltransferase n=1 Tax=Apilactobacillus timberlakei TaxID=2008380 RepID=UPI00112DC893|nr:GNAT family N-acetyltransferase [Apilactobacillus timberlakei]TPR23157.1 GNAT family N-acetyltransferase [Apilactobacillus timberlakei]